MVQVYNHAEGSAAFHLICASPGLNQIGARSSLCGLNRNGRLVSQIFPQQRKLMGSSAQNSSGVHWCRRRVRFNEVPEKVLKVPEKVWEASVQSQVRFNEVPEKVPVKVWEASVQGQVRFNRVPEKVQEKVPEKVPEKVWEALVQSQVKFNRVPEKVPGGVGAEPGQVQQSGEGSGEGVEGFGAEPGQVQQDLRPSNSRKLS